MKRIIILCDGTWNHSDSRTPTNVVRLGQAIARVDPQGVVQVPFYVQGVGTGRGVSRVSRSADTILGGALGWGLLANIEAAYRHLVFAYDPGDEIYIFGFSRGAYTARSLTGFIRSTGIVPRRNLHEIPAAMRRYRQMDRADTHPSSERSHARRAYWSPEIATSRAEVAWRQTQNMPAPHLLEVDYLGVWDSVGALGVPSHIPLIGRLAAQRYRFHDADLSSMVKSARHAVALDERRKSFRPTRWGNVGELNARSTAPAGRPYREEFFAGDHGSIGGGGEITSLSNIGLRWIAEGAMQAGLFLDPDIMAGYAEDEDLDGPLRNTTQPGGWTDRLTRIGALDREGPGAMAAVHQSALARWGRGTPPYRPGSMNRIASEITRGTPEPEE